MDDLPKQELRTFLRLLDDPLFVFNLGIFTGVVLTLFFIICIHIIKHNW